MTAKNSIRKYFDVAWFMWRRALAFILDVASGSIPAYFVVDALHDAFHISTPLVVLCFAAVVTSVNVFFCLIPITRNLFLRAFGLRLLDFSGSPVPLKLQVIRLVVRNFLFPLIVFEYILGSKQFLHDWTTKSYVVRKGEIPNEQFQWRRFGWICLNITLGIAYFAIGLCGQTLGSQLSYTYFDLRDWIEKVGPSAKMKRVIKEWDNPNQLTRLDPEQVSLDILTSTTILEALNRQKSETDQGEKDLELFLANQLMVRKRCSYLYQHLSREAKEQVGSNRDIIEGFSTFITLPEDRLRSVMSKQVTQPVVPWKSIQDQATTLTARELYRSGMTDEGYCNEAYLKHLDTEGKKMSYLWCLRKLRDNYFADDMYRAKSGSFENEVRKLEEKWHLHSFKNSNS